MIFVRLLLTGVIFFFTVPRYLIDGNRPRQTNTAPVVHIGSPNDAAIFSPGMLVPYSVTVWDKEDGESKFEEIPAVEVFMELRYFPDAAKAAAYRTANTKDPAAYTLFKKGDCFNCHAVHAKVIGPSFSDIAAKYKKTDDVASVAAHVMKGSTGIWGTAVMPTHPDLNERDARQIVRWILAAGSDKTTEFFRGAEGAVRLPVPSKISPAGIFLLKASYTDHGLDKSNTGTLTGQDFRRIRLH